MKKRALVSVSDKRGLVAFVGGLVALNYEIVSTGGTKRALEEAGIATIGVDEVTGFPEMLDGRVKTLHPKVHGGLLAVRDNGLHQKEMATQHISYIDLVCVNLYPFQETIAKPGFTPEEAIENIDIGGPSMLRSSAKNHAFVTVVCDALDYDMVLAELQQYGDTTLLTRQRLAAKAFRTTASYDAMIAEYMTDLVHEEAPETLTLTYRLKQSLRYGENPHQGAKFYQSMKRMQDSIASARQRHGKELSYNNIQDANAALLLLREFEEPAVVVVKHMNPCGVGVASSIEDAYQKAYEADSISIFGGIVACNREVSLPMAMAMGELFLEIILAPSFADEAFALLAKKKNIRLLEIDPSYDVMYEKQFVSVSGGLLVQDTNHKTTSVDQFQLVTMKGYAPDQVDDLLFAEKIVKHVKSNAIVIVKNKQTLGIGAGQMNRVGAAKIALEQASASTQGTSGSVMGSDAFFPMDDTVRLASSYGVTAIVQPGGSLKDKDSILACDALGMAMVFTGTRHFRH